MIKKILSVILCLAMLAGMVPVANAAGGTYTVKYAVSLYGICEDVDKDGNQLGLTFGPATGASYVSSYKACDGTSESSPGDCLHWKSWDKIIALSGTNPHIFDNCLKNGCTHSVELNINSKIAGSSIYQGKMDDGDGAGMILNSIKRDYNKWNSDNFNYGGWPASRVRAMLNGSDEYTADGTGVSSDTRIYYNGYTDLAGTDMEGFTASDALISVFPAELREAIVPRAVTSDTKYDDWTDTIYTFTTYDKLWLFSGAEVYQESGNYFNDGAIRHNEGTPYSRTTELGITTSSYDANKSYCESNSTYDWWLRTPSQSQEVCSVYDTGKLRSLHASYTLSGIAPGFCLNGTPTSLIPSDPYTVKYAVSIYGINEDVGMPSGDSPAEGQTVYHPGEDIAITSTIAADGDTVTFKPLWEGSPKIPLTFGPAMGENYAHAYKACPGTSKEAPGTCMHWMTWEQIITQARTDPEVFRPCLSNGCTHSVLLNINSKIASGASFQGQMDFGDGAGTLRYSIAENYRSFCAEGVGGNGGGWRASRVRAVLNGSDEYADYSAGRDMKGFTSADALISAFPAELQAAIVPKTVKSDTNDGDISGNNVTTYDKLWLLSTVEVYQASGVYNDNIIRPNEGTQYSRFVERNISTSNYQGCFTYNEYNGTNDWLTRSIRYQNILYVYSGGSSPVSDTSINGGTYNGISPCFCIG